MPAPILHAAQEQSGSIRKQRGAGVKHAMDRIRPIGGGQDGIEFMTAKEFWLWMIH
jgi:hypothetical protein